jgi:hypothetical protein
MSGMMHHHSSATTNPDGDTGTAGCPNRCDEAGHLNLPRKPTGQVTEWQLGTLDLDKLNQVAAPKVASAFIVYGGPPDQHKTGPAFSILRV